MPIRDHDPHTVRLPIRVTTDSSGAIVGIERTPPATPRAGASATPFKCWRGDVFLDDERLQDCDSQELLVPHAQAELVFNALCETARRSSPQADFLAFRSWPDYRAAVERHQSLQGAAP